MSDYRLIQGDCLDVLPGLAAGSVDCIIADPPYGTTACAWDAVIPLAPMWEQLKRIVKPGGAVVLFGAQPFTSMLVMSNLDQFKYEWVWKKSKPNGWQHAQNKPMKANEDILIFSAAPMGHDSLLGDARMHYTPQGIRSAGLGTVKPYWHGRTMGARPHQVGRNYEAFTGFPSNILEYANITGDEAEHPTQKPVSLLRYLIRTYTNPGETVLDFTMGSGTTGVACRMEGRSFIGIELDPHYYAIAERRIAQAQPPLFVPDAEPQPQPEQAAMWGANP
jgi:site-specific DNA-methyltransferase (adenine-specific)